MNYELLHCQLQCIACSQLYHSVVMFSGVVLHQALAAHQVLAVAAQVQDPAVVEVAAQGQAVAQVGVVVGQVAVVVVRMSNHFFIIKILGCNNLNFLC